MDVPRLIEEVRLRPTLWNSGCVDNKERYNMLPKLWKEVADAVAADVEQCKRKWKNLRDAYRAEVRRFQRRMERDKLIGAYDPNTNYNSKWVHFELMNFISDNKRSRRSFTDHENTSSNEATNYDATTFQRLEGDSEMEERPNNASGVQPEATREDDSDDDNDHHHDDDDDDNDRDFDNDDDDMANDMLFEEFQSIATPQAARRLSASLSMTNSLEQNLSNESPAKHSSHSTSDASSTAQKDCSCPNRREERMHFLEDLEKEEQQLMQSTTRDINRAVSHIGDSDYNFLVSFLPHMKKMSDLHNLQFRGRMCELVLNILAPTITGQNAQAAVAVPPPLTPAPAIVALENTPLRQVTSSGYSFSASNGTTNGGND